MVIPTQSKTSSSSGFTEILGIGMVKEVLGCPKGTSRGLGYWKTSASLLQFLALRPRLLLELVTWRLLSDFLGLSR